MKPTRGRGRLAGLAAAAVLAVTGAGCGTVTGQARPSAGPPAGPGLATSLATQGGGAWAVLVLGGPAAHEDNFWQLFTRPAGSAAWRLVTPPGVASNGGLVMASPGGQSLLAGFRPSQDLVFSPLARTSDGGSAWSSAVLDARLADVPDALAAAPGGSQLVALLANGQIDQAGPGAAAWSALASLRSLAATPAGRRCAPTALTAVSLTPSGTALAGAACTRPGVTGVFSYTPGTRAAGRGTWRAAGPALPATLAGRTVRVLRLTGTPAGEVAMLAAGSGRTADLLAAWAGSGGRWAVSAPLALGATAVRAAGSGAGGAAWVLLASGQADTIATVAAGWQPVPRPPAQTAVLAAGPAGSLDALAGHGSQLTVWRLARGSATWTRAQVLNVPIQYGSSG